MKVGEDWAYRARGVDELEPVQVEKLGNAKPARVLIRFLADDREGKLEWVPVPRLKTLWSEVEAYRGHQRRWAAVIADSPYETPEVDAANTVYERVIDPAMAELEESHRAGYLRIHEPEALATWLGWPSDQLRNHSTCFEEDGDLIAPWPIAQAVAQAAAQKAPQRLLDHVIEEEIKAQQQAIHGETLRSPRGKDWYIPPDRAAAYDREHHRPVRDLLRQWCGAPAVEEREELEALRIEILRVGAVAEQAIRALRAAGQAGLADRLNADLGRPAEQLRSP